MTEMAGFAVVIALANLSVVIILCAIDYTLGEIVRELKRLQK